MNAVKFESSTLVNDFFCKHLRSLSLLPYPVGVLRFWARSCGTENVLALDFIGPHGFIFYHVLRSARLHPRVSQSITQSVTYRPRIPVTLVRITIIEDESSMTPAQLTYVG